MEICKNDESSCHKNLYTSIRFGLQRKFKDFDNSVDIIDGSEFKDCNEVFKAQMVQLKNNRLVKTNHKTPYMTIHDYI